MSFFMSAKFGNEHKMKRVGSNMSEIGLATILLAGYASGKFAESSRVRRWIGPADSQFYGDEYNERIDKEAPGLPTRFRITRSMRDLKALMTYNHNNQHWFELEVNSGKRSLDTALKMKKATCPILIPVVDFLHHVEQRNVLPLTPHQSLALLNSIQQIQPLLAGNCWAGDVEQVGGVLEFAVKHNVPVVLG